MSFESQLTAVLQIILAAILSMLIGIDRERRGRPAGLRTHMLVGIGACLFTSLSKNAFPGNTTAQVAANVVTGIGFLGAGALLQHNGSGVFGVTTAAGIWATAAIGMAVGADAWFLAICTTLLIWFILVVILGIEQRAWPENDNNAKPRSESP